jgi:MoaA/NifB/PqqE/SkfB family radical SAM enzyme
MVSETVRRTFFIVPKLPKTVQFEITNRCNLACKMCPREFLKVKFKHMPLPMFKKMVDKLKGVEEVILTGWGEPLYHPDIVEMVKYCKSKGLAARFTTNGILLTERLMEDFIKVGLDEIAFSVETVRPHGKGEWGHMNRGALLNIEGLIRKKGVRIKPDITLQPMLQKGNKRNILDIIKWAGKHKIRRVNIGRLDTRFDPNLLRPTKKDEKDIFTSAERLGKSLGVQVDCVQYGLFSGISRAIYKRFKHLIHKRGKHCLKIFDYIYVNVDGMVTPCCLLPHDVMGDLKKRSLSAIWNSDKFRKRRNTPHPSCKNCDVMKIKMIGD